MRKLAVAAVAALLASSGATAALANPNGKGPDPNGPAKQGLCTAYFNGQKNGHGKNGNNPPPFRNLEQAADEADDEPDGVGTPDEVAAFCSGLVGGNPSQGRYPQFFE